MDRMLLRFLPLCALREFPVHSLLSFLKQPKKAGRRSSAFSEYGHRPFRMTNPARQPSQSYTALTQHVVREAKEPLPVAEITRRIHRLCPIEARSPEGAIRN